MKNSVEHLAYLSIQERIHDPHTITVKLSSLTIQSYSNQNITLAQKQTQGSMERLERPRNKPTPTVYQLSTKGTQNI